MEISVTVIAPPPVTLALGQDFSNVSLNAVLTQINASIAVLLLGL